jgi:hypothetical protein
MDRDLQMESILFHSTGPVILPLIQIWAERDGGKERD